MKDIAQVLVAWNSLAIDAQTESKAKLSVILTNYFVSVYTGAYLLRRGLGLPLEY